MWRSPRSSARRRRSRALKRRRRSGGDGADAGAETFGFLGGEWTNMTNKRRRSRRATRDGRLCTKMRACRYDYHIHTNERRVGHPEPMHRDTGGGLLESRGGPRSRRELLPFFGSAASKRPMRKLVSDACNPNFKCSECIPSGRRTCGLLSFAQLSSSGDSSPHPRLSANRNLHCRRKPLKK